ncbi:MAG: DNA alkylation repair protein, partial [Myxococcota bacterium]
AMAVKRKLVSSIRSALEDAGVAKDARPMQAYMKSEMPYRGVKKPARVAALKPIFAEASIDRYEDLRDTVLALWRKAKFREERYAAIDLLRLRAYRAYLVPDALPLIEELIVTGAWWDHVDELAVHAVGPIVKSAPRPMKKTMRRWSKGDDMWKARTSIIFQLMYKKETDFPLLQACMEPSLDSKEFFLRKAIGWALRNASRVDPDWVIAYIEERADRLSGLSKREGLKHLLKAGVVKTIP